MAPVLETALIVCGAVAAVLVALIAAFVFSGWVAASPAPWIWVSAALLLSTLGGRVARRFIARRRARQLAQAHGRRELGLNDAAGR